MRFSRRMTFRNYSHAQQIPAFPQRDRMQHILLHNTSFVHAALYPVSTASHIVYFSIFYIEL